MSHLISHNERLVEKHFISFTILSGGRYSIIHNQMHLQEYSIGNHLCTNIAMLEISCFFSLQYYVITFPFSSEDRYGFILIIIIMRGFFFIFILPLLNETIVFSRKKTH